MRAFSIRTKLITVVAVVSLVLTLFIGVFVFYNFRNIFIREHISNVERISAEQIKEIRGVFDKYEMFAKMLGTRTRVREYLLDRTEVRREELLGIFSDYSLQDSNVLSIYLMDDSGITLVSTDPSFVGQNYSFRDYFKHAKEGKPNVKMSLGKTSNEFGYYFAHPVVFESQVVGVLTIKIKEIFINQSLIDSSLAKTETIMFTDDYGVIVYSNRPERFLQSLGELSSEEVAQLRTDGRFLDKDINSLQYAEARRLITDYSGPNSLEVEDEEDGERESLYVEKVGNLPFFLVVESGFEKIEKTVIGFVGATVGVITAASLIIIWLGYWFFSVLILRPLKKINYVANNIMNGDFSSRVDITNKDEIGTLASVMNLMSEKLDKYYDELAERVKKQVEEIESKTKSLNDQQRATLNILEDIAEEKKKVETLANDLEKFKLAVDNASDHIVITDSEGLVVYGNKAVEKVTGYTVKEAFGKKAGVLWKLPMPDEFYKKLWDTIKVKKQVFISEVQNRRKNGEVYIASISISPVLNEKDEVVFFVGIERDITREKQIDQAKTEFVSLASHQLRTPLSAINWYAEMLLNGDAGRLKSEQANYVQEIYRGNQRMVELVNALLNVSRLELGTFMVEPTVCDIRKIADEAIDEIDHKMYEKQIKFSKKYDKKIKEMNLDKKLTMIIFQNLLSNATKYTPAKGKIHLAIEIVGKKLLITVSDNGMGIPKTQQDKIFSKLFRADNVRKTDTEGTGLGLYIIKSIVENVGGKIWFESEEDKGTAFFVTIPISGMKKKEGAKSLS